MATVATRCRIYGTHLTTRSQATLLRSVVTSSVLTLREYGIFHCKLYVQYYIHLLQYNILRCITKKCGEDTSSDTRSNS